VWDWNGITGNRRLVSIQWNDGDDIMANGMNYRVTLEHRPENKVPVITPVLITKNQYDRILKIVYERKFDRHGNNYNYVNKVVDEE